MKKILISLLLVFALIIGSAIVFASCDKGEEKKEAGNSETKETVNGSGDNTENTEGGSSSDTESDSGEDSSESDTDKAPACEHPYAATADGHWKPACDVCGKKEGKVQSHEYEERVEDEGDLLVYALRCTVCKYRAYEQEVPYEINSFYSAGELAFAEATGDLTGSFASEAGMGYASYSSDKGGSVNLVVLSGGEIEDPSGNYLVMKLRMAKSQSSFTASIKSVGANASVNMSFSGLRAGWITIIVDITKAVKDGTDNTGAVTKLGYQPDASGEYYLGDFRLVASAGAGESFDVGYIMFCDTLEDAQNFTANEKTVITYDDVLNKGGTSNQKECVDENGNIIKHEYVINDDGTHTLAKTCYQCGLAAVENEPHIYSQIQLDDGDFTYACGACGHSQFGANINKYIAADQIAEKAPTYYKVTQLGVKTDEEGGFDYASFSGMRTTAQILFARNNNVSSPAEELGAFDVGKANYFILKMRTTNPEVSFGIQIGTEDDGVTNFKFPTDIATANEWTVYVVDLAAVMPNTYAPDGNGDFKVTQFYYHIGGTDFTEDVVYDVQYNAFVDTWEEVDAIVEEDTIVHVTAANTGSVVATKDKSCIGTHGYVIESENGVHSVKCSSCGYVYKSYDVPGAMLFYPAEVLNSITQKNGKLDITYTDDGNGQTFVHLDNMKDNGPDAGSWMGWNVINTSIGVQSGRFMVIKLRIGENGLGQNYLKLYTGTSQHVVSEGQAISLKVSEDGQWHTIVVDLYTRIGDPSTYMTPEGDGSFLLRALQIRPFSNAQTKTEPDDWMDIEYIAFCDQLEDLANIISEEEYEWSVSTSENEIRNVSDVGGGTLPEVPKDPNLYHEITESSNTEEDGSVTYTFTCSHCDMNIVKNVPVNALGYYMSPNVIASTATVYYKIPAHKIASDGTNTYSRFTGEGLTAQTIWYRVQEDCKYDTLTGQPFFGKTLDVGESKYLIIKARTNNVNQSLLIAMSTTARNSETATADASIVKPDKVYYDINGNKLEIGATYCTENAFQTISIPLAAAENDEWAVYAINLSEVLGEYYGKDSETGTYVIDTFYFHMLDLAGSTNIDIEYMTFVKEWADIQTIVDESTVVNVADTKGTYGIVDTVTGQCAKHNGVVDVVDGKYVSRCSVCYVQFVDYGVSADSVSTFLPAETLTTSGSIVGECDRVYMTENGVPFVRISNLKTNGPSNGNWMGITPIGTAGQEHQAKYMVIKLRIGENGLSQSVLEFFASTKSANALANGSRISVKVSEDGQWHTIVVDLSARVVDPSFYAPDTDGNHYLRYLQFRPFSGYQTTAQADDYMDISYIALFNDLDELKNIISEETYEWSIDNATSSVKNTESGACVTHTLGETVTGDQHIVACKSCGETVRSFTVPTEVNWYSDLGQMSNYQHSLDKYQYDADANVIYNSFYGIEGNHINITGGGGAGAADTDTFVAGQYFVMKYRATSSSGVMKLKISSDGLVGNELPVFVGQREYTHLHNEWTVVVIDLSELEHYRVGELGNFYAMIQTEGTYVFDISYVAVVDSLEEVELLLGDGESYVDLGKSWSTEVK